MENISIRIDAECLKLLDMQPVTRSEAVRRAIISVYGDDTLPPDSRQSKRANAGIKSDWPVDPVEIVGAVNHIMETEGLGPVAAAKAVGFSYSTYRRKKIELEDGRAQG